MALLLNVTAVAHRPIGSPYAVGGLNLNILVTDPTGAPYRSLTQEHFQVQIMGHDLALVDGAVDHVNELARQIPANGRQGSIM
jgi:hypothetical protein